MNFGIKHSTSTAAPPSEARGALSGINLWLSPWNEECVIIAKNLTQLFENWYSR